MFRRPNRGSRARDPVTIPRVVDPAGTPYARKTDGGGQIKTGFNAACRRAGITDFSPRDCRHTWATWHYAANRDLVALMELGGWQSEKMVLRYAHMNVSQAKPIRRELAPYRNSGGCVFRFVRVRPHAFPVKRAHA